MATIGKYSYKVYKCSFCGHERQEGTNHWGEIYSPCPACRWKRPPLYHAHRSVCMEPPPEGYGTPEPWAVVKLGDLAEVR